MTQDESKLPTESGEISANQDLSTSQERNLPLRLASILLE